MKVLRKSGLKIFSVLYLLLLLSSNSHLRFEVLTVSETDVSLTIEGFSEPCILLDRLGANNDCFNRNTCSKNSASLDSFIVLSFKHINLYAALF